MFSDLAPSLGDRVAIMLNNLGGTSLMEFYIMIRAAVSYLGENVLFFLLKN